MTRDRSIDRSFGEEVAFLADHNETIVLSTPDRRAKIAVVPAYQGRIMTATSCGDAGRSTGFINHGLIESGVRQSHINPVGGEDRLWIGPEGGQFSVFFAPGSAEQTLDHWFTPACMDSEPFAVSFSDSEQVSLTHSAELRNHSGTRFKARIERVVRLVPGWLAVAEFGCPADPRLSVVAFESSNSLVNVGAEPWKRDSGLLSVWVLGMFKAGDAARVVIPTNLPAGLASNGAVNDAYFGNIPPDRLRAVEYTKDSLTHQAFVFRADGRSRGKVGVSPRAALPLVAAFDRSCGLLTVVSFGPLLPAAGYVNSAWEMPQAHPYSGDAVNAYNDGPSPSGGEPLGSFFEIESSSPAAALSPGEKITHTHRTVHIEGAPAALDGVARHLLGLSLDQIDQALP